MRTLARAAPGRLGLSTLAYVFSQAGWDLPYRLIKSRWLVGTDDLFTVETIHSSRGVNILVGVTGKGQSQLRLNRAEAETCWAHSIE